MPHANGSSKGATKRGAKEQIPMQSTKAGHEKTDYSRWRLRDDRGCQTWHYLKTDEEIKAWPQSTADKYFLGKETVSQRLRAYTMNNQIYEYSS